MPILETMALIAGGAYLLKSEDEEAVDSAPESGGVDTSEAYEVSNTGASRGRVIVLTPQQIVNRALYLIGELRIEGLDLYIDERRNSAPVECPVIYYRLKDYNGGKDPAAPDPATRWQAHAGGQTNVTCDCVGGAMWCAGCDRYQPERFSHIYGGWINTDSMIQDARGPAKCFIVLDEPEPGCFVVAPSGSGKEDGSIGHIGVVLEVGDGWESDWSRIGVANVAAYGAGQRANRRTTAKSWQARNSIFCKSIMTW